MREYLFFTTWIALKIIIIITLMLSLVVSNHLREAVKNYLADFSTKGGGYPPFPLSVFGQDDFPLRGGGGNPQFR